MVKLAYVQQKKGIRTSWIGETVPSFQRTIPFETWNSGNLARFGGLKVPMFAQEEETDVFHVHTHEQDLRILAAVLENTKKPVVWDVHDEPKADIPEGAPASRFAPAKRLTGENGTVWNTYCPKDWFAEPKEPKNHLVIATGLSDVPGHYRYWLDTFWEMGRRGIKITCYTTSVLTEEYKEVCDLRAAIDVRELIEEMSYAFAGIVGTPQLYHENMRSAQPNKLYEYVAAGIPVICFGSDLAMAEVVKTYNLGVVIDSVEEMGQALKTIKAKNLRESVLRERFRFTMESEEPKVAAAYEKAVKSWSK